MFFSTAHGRSLSGARFWMAARAVLYACVASLAIFHAYLLADQIAEGEIGDPAVALRWLIAAGLVGALVELQRRGATLFGRRAVAAWLLAGLLHGPALARPDSTFTAATLPDVVASAVQVVVAGGCLGLVLLAATCRRQATTPLALAGLLPLERGPRIVRPARLDSHSPRPPPRASFAARQLAFRLSPI